MYEHFDDTVAKIVLAAEEGDSVRRVSQKIEQPYETVRQKVKNLKRAGMVRTEGGFEITAPSVERSVYQSVTAGSRLSSPSVEEAYVVPHFADRRFAFTRIDAVYVWTRGGYRVSRSKEDYPIFVAVDTSVDYWKNFFEDFGLPVNEKRKPVDEIEGSIQIVVEKHDGLELERVDGQPVIPINETVEYMQDNYVHFQPALEMLDKMYDEIDLDVSYDEKHEREVA